MSYMRQTMIASTSSCGSLAIWEICVAGTPRVPPQSNHAILSLGLYQIVLTSSSIAIGCQDRNSEKWPITVPDKDDVGVFTGDIVVVIGSGILVASTRSKSLDPSRGRRI